MTKKVLLLILIIKSLLAGEIFLAASANVSYALNDLIKEFKKQYPNIIVKTTLASSGKLTAQIMHSAPYDLFLSANMKYPEILYKKGFAITKPKVYAKGAIALFSVKYKPSLDLLLKVSQIAIANPKFAPYGLAAVEVFKNRGIYDKIKDKLIYSETVSGVIPYVLHSADIGVVAKSSLYSRKIKQIGKFFYKDIDKRLYTPIKQGVVLLKDNEDARKFYDFLFSKKAKEIFKKYGYIE
jgi:molybdate transport system substrate-binding protein